MAKIEHMEERKLHEFARNTLTDRKEIGAVIDWIEADPAHKRAFIRIKNLWSYMDFKDFEDLNKSENFQTNTRRHFISGMLKYVAIFIMAFFAGGSVFYSVFHNGLTGAVGYNQIVVPRGQSAEVILPDQSKVWLNSGAIMKYPTTFGKKYRDVELCGEAFFDVKKKKNIPFRVKTSDIRVNVLGTSFNVAAFRKSESIDVTLVEGKVRIELPNGDLLSELKPNKKASFNRHSKTLNVSEVDTKFYTSWKEGILFFRNEPLDNIAQRLELWYNVEITFEEPRLKELKYSGSILKNKPIDQILEILKYTANIDYSIEVSDLEPIVIIIKEMPMEKSGT